MALKQFNSVQRRLFRRNLRIIAIFIFFTALISMTFLFIYREMNDDVYAGLIEENLIMAHRDQVSSTRSSIEEARRLMTNVAQLQAQEPAGHPMPEEYLDIFDSLNNLYDVEYYSREKLEEILTYPECPEGDRVTISRVLEGETFVSDVRISSRLNQVCDFTIAVPVMTGEEATGGIFGQVKAELLTHIAQFQEDGMTDNYLLLGDGSLVYGNQTFFDGAYNIFEEMEKKGISKDKIREMNLILNDNKEHVLELKELAKGTVYLMVTDIGYNGWKLLSVSYLEQMDFYVSTTMKNTALIVSMLFAVFALITVMMAVSLNWMRKRTLEKQANYELLARFSDTILFYYDCKTKKISYTPNIVRNYHIDEYENIPFLEENYKPQALHPDDEKIFTDAILRMAQDRTLSDEAISLRFKSRSGEYVWLSYSLSRLRDKKGRVYAVVGKMNDIHDYKVHEMNLVETYSRDGLTGAYNRASTEQLISEALDGSHPGIFLLLDVDNFKYANDHFGHAAGDRILKQIVEKAREEFGSQSIIGRIGGDEFVIYMKDCREKKEAEERITGLFSRLPEMGSCRVTLSVGGAFYPGQGKSFAGLYRQADKAMYQAKNKGKNGFCFCAEPFEEDSAGEV